MKGWSRMKRIVSVLCVLCLLLGVFSVCAVGASAVTAAETVVAVSEGDLISYTLLLDKVPGRVLGCDFSFYYDSSFFEVVSVADFTGSTDKKECAAAINEKLNDEVRGSLSILSGVDFSTARPLLTVNLVAVKNGSCHLSYYIRYLYDFSIFDSDDRPQVTQYKFTCDVTKNRETMLKNAQPELNLEKPQKNGLFVNSLTGDSKDADPTIPGTVGDPGYTPPVVVATAAVSGSVTSFLSDTDPITVLLKKDNSVEDSVIVSGNTARYSFTDVEQGTYIISVLKKNHASREYEVTVTNEDVRQDVKICPKGDATGDGKVTNADYSRVNQHVCKVKPLTGYERKCADVIANSDVTNADLARINQHVCKVKPLWD